MSLAASPSGLPGVRTLVQRLLASAFGPPPFDPDADPGDLGLTGPGSPSWRVIAEPAAIAGGVRGLILQAAHPLAMAGVHDHSRFRTDPLGRLQRTSAYVVTSVFGSTAEALDVAAVVRRVHPHVRGTAPDGRPYRADDPHLLAWVGLALTSSFLAAHQRWAPHPLGPGDADRFVLEQSRIAALLDPRVDLAALRRDPEAGAALRADQVELPMLADGTLPRTVAQLHGTMDAFHPELRAGPQAREALRFLRRPPLPLPLRAGYRTLHAGAVGSLRPRERAVLGLEMPEVVARSATATTQVALSAVRLSTGTSPSAELAAHRAGTPVRAA